MPESWKETTLANKQAIRRFYKSQQLRWDDSERARLAREELERRIIQLEIQVEKLRNLVGDCVDGSDEEEDFTYKFGYNI